VSRYYNRGKSERRNRARCSDLPGGEQHGVGQLPHHLWPRGKRVHRALPGGHVQGLGPHHERRHRLARSESSSPPQSSWSSSAFSSLSACPPSCPRTSGPWFLIPDVDSECNFSTHAWSPRCYKTDYEYIITLSLASPTIVFTLTKENNCAIVEAA